MGSKILAGRYELLEKIGDGGMAIVYKARCRLLNRFVAIKILKPEFIKDAKFIESFRRESQAAASLSHPNIVSVYDVGKEGNINYIVMELLEGETLSDVIKRKAPMDPEDVIDVSMQIASALSTAHKNNIIHRDVKPHNVLISEEGIAKITDFGIAKAVNSGTIVNNTSTVMGSVHYLSPEQARGGYVDEKSDIYSLGIVMFEMLTGKVPFNGENAVAVAMMHMNGDVPPPSTLNPNVPEILDRIVLKATSKYQSNRFKSAEEMYIVLDDALHIIENELPGSRPNGSIAGISSDTPLSHSQKQERQVYMAVEKGQRQGPAYHNREDVYEEDEDEEYSDYDRKQAIVKKKEKKGKKDIQGSKKTKSKYNKIKVLAILLALICALFASQFILSMVNGGGAPKTSVPNVLGLSADQAIAELKKHNLDYVLGSDVYSDEYEEGLIAAQKPEAEMTVKEGYKVSISLSKGTTGGVIDENDDTSGEDQSQDKNIKIPELKGKTLAAAISLLEDYGLKAEPSYEESDTPEGLVIRQSPAKGTMAAAGETVQIVVSQGKPEVYVSMPSLIGKTEQAARDSLATAGLVAGEVSQEYNDKYDKGKVLYQQYNSGSDLAKGTSVNFTISLGPEEVTPKDIKLTINYNKAKNEVFHLTVSVTDDNGLSFIVSNEQRIRADGSEVVTLTGKGTGLVRVIFDSELVNEYSVNFNTGELH